MIENSTMRILLLVEMESGERYTTKELINSPSEQAIKFQDEETKLWTFVKDISTIFKIQPTIRKEE